MRNLVVVAMFLVAPLATAEYGDEGPHGFPVNIDGVEVLPYLPADLVERHPELAAEWLAHHGAGGTDVLPSPRNKVGGATVYPYYPILTAEVQRLAEDHPDLVRLSSAGKSRLGLDIWLLEIADFDNPERIPLAEREVVYLDGGTHSNEYSGVYFVLEWAQHLVDDYDTDERVQWIVENRHIFILPMINPDGSHLFGRLNALGVNINRNFPATWGTTDEQPPMNYPGPYPNSEPETRTVGDLFSTLRPDYAGSVHCCGNLWLAPYGAEHLGDPHDVAMFDKTCDIIFSDVRDACGPIWSTIYPAGGSTVDEAYERAGSAAWGFEMSGRTDIPSATWGYPVTFSEVQEQEIESWGAVMHAMLHVDLYGAKPVIDRIQVVGGEYQVTVTNQGLGNLTEGTISVGGSAVPLPFMPAATTTTFAISAGSADDVPVELTWKKRLHPESGWGRTTFVAGFVDTAAGLVAELPVAEARPTMDDIHGDATANTFPEPTVLTAAPGGEAATPGPGAFAALVLAAAAVLINRRLQG